ncbi:MAG: hypothetical protein AB7N71_15360, partial [Phycisphaerae bacterium]
VPRRYRVVAVGESAPEDKKIFENARDRAVGVVARLTGRMPPKPEPIDIGEILRPKPAARKDFTLQVVSFVAQNVGIGIPETPIDLHYGRIAMNFTINDGVMTTKYTFVGQGPGSGVSTFFAGGARSIARGKPQKFSAYAKLDSGDFAGKGSISGITDTFLFGGRSRTAGASAGWHDFPSGTIRRFAFPPSLPGLPGKDEFSGEVTKGFKPLVPEYPDPLPPSGIF